VELLLATQRLAGPGGVQTYMLTVAPHLERLGHQVTLHAEELGTMAEVAREHGLRVARDDELPERCDALLAQDGATLLALAGRYPDAVRAIVVHGAEYDLHLPAGIDGLAALAIVMNSVIERRMRATAHPPPLVRLRQPIDTQRFRPLGVVRERPERVLMLGNYLSDRERDALAQACDEAGLEWRQAGLHGELLADPVQAISDADIVVGQGRSLLEAMACGRAAWLYGPGAGDGWVTPANYAAIEGDGFRGRALAEHHDAGSFARAIAEYDVAMGEQNRGLVMLHHTGYAHAVELVEALAGGVPERPPADAPLRELERLVRTQHDAQVRTGELARRLRVVNDAYEALHEKHDALWRERDELRDLRVGDHREAVARIERADRELAECREWNAELERRIAAITGSRRWRALALAARPLEAVRRLRR
jgi:hypothetical protein